jgi:NAD-dependent SIR2 family protein deacetylase
MTVLNCNRCGNEFDTNREPTVPGASTSRCPSCGADHDHDDHEGQTTTVPDGATIENLEVHEGGTVVIGNGD